MLADRVGVLVDGRVLQIGTPGRARRRPGRRRSSRASPGANVLAGVAPAGAGRADRGRRSTTGGTRLLGRTRRRAGVGRRLPLGGLDRARGARRLGSLNHVRAPITSLVALGNRARVQVGPLVGEVTTASVERLGLREGETVVASFKAAAARLLPLA